MSVHNTVCPLRCTDQSVRRFSVDSLFIVTDVSRVNEFVIMFSSDGLFVKVFCDTNTGKVSDDVCIVTVS